MKFDPNNLGKLYLLPTGLSPESGKLELGIRILDTYRQLKHYLVEDIRSARRFISSLKLGLTIEELEFETLNKSTKFEELQDLFDPVFSGYDLGLMSEAGCPGIADPGALAVDFAHSFGIQVIPMTGPSSILMALMASGFNGQSFAFLGYLPIEKVGKLKKIKEIERVSFSQKQTQIFIETPYRNQAMFIDLVRTCKPTTRLTIACDITAPSEFIQTKTIEKWKSVKMDIKKRPTVFLIQA